MNDRAIEPCGQDRWEALAQLALRGLRNTYSAAERLPHTMRVTDSGCIPHGHNVRYAVITLLGLGKVRTLGLPADDLVETLWERIESSHSSIAASAGDLGLLLWAQSMTDRKGLVSASQALKAFEQNRGSLDSVHLAWIVLGATHALTTNPHSDAELLAGRAADDLLALFEPASSLFYRHEQTGLVRSVSRRVPCFANQIYPVMALAKYGRDTGCERSLKTGRMTADQLCRLQGSSGQWWWLYDAATGSVVDGYPVFSVHQDGMAPMALLETSAAGGRCYDSEIDQGLSWIFGNNELKTNLIAREPGLVLRDIHLKGVGRMRRAARSARWCWGLGRRPRPVECRESFTVNRECRPYHLGWILYGAGLASERKRSAGHESGSAASVGMSQIRT